MNESKPGILSKWSEQGPFILAVILTLGYVLLVESSVLKAAGVFSYPLDDPFIHMQIARDLTQHGTWGINPGEFASASSSVLYTLLLTLLFKFFGVHVLVPFLINIIAAIVLLWVIHRWLLRQQTGALPRLLILLVIVFFTPLPVLIISGMEHVLQCIFAFLFITSFAAWMEEKPASLPGAGQGSGARSWRLPPAVYVYAMLLTAIRYEGLFLVMIAGLILLFNRKLLTAIGLGLAALSVIAIFGCIAVARGSYFLPNSVLMKADGVEPSLTGILSFISNTLVYKWSSVSPPPANGVVAPGISLPVTQRLLILLPLVFLLFPEAMRRRPSWRWFIILVTGCTLLHLALAATGWLYRYEAYLVLCSFAIGSVVLYQYGWQTLKDKGWLGWLMAVLLAFMVLFPFVLRSSAAYTKIRRACLNIHDQQYQMGQFLGKYYKGSVVAANDIGAISFYGGLDVVDLWGLGNIDVARSKKGKYWTPVFLDSLVRARKTKLAIVYETWFPRPLLDKWTKVATWQMPDNVIAGSDVVTFYAIDPADKSGIASNLKAFEGDLPKEISVVYY